MENPCSQAGQKGSRCETREKSTRVGVLRKYVGATPSGAKMIPAATERNYPKRLPRVGWGQMGLFQRSVLEIDKPSRPRLKYGPVEATRSREKVWTKDSVQSAEQPVERIKKRWASYRVWH